MTGISVVKPVITTSILTEPVVNALMRPEAAPNIAKNVEDKIIDLKKLTATDVTVIALTTILSGGVVLLIGLPIWLALERAELQSAQDKATKIYEKASDALLTELFKQRKSNGEEIPRDHDITITVQVSEDSNDTITAKQTYSGGTTTVSITYQNVTVEDKSSLEDLTNQLASPHLDHRTFRPTELIQSVKEDFDQKQVREEKSVTQGKLSDTKKLRDKSGQFFYYKPLTPKFIGGSGQIVCISSKDSRVAQRSIFTYVMSEVLGFHIVPKTALTSLNGAQGYVQYEAPGQSAKNYLKGLDESQLDPLKSNGPLLKKMIEMQLLDSLTGQADRHCGNYFIDENTNQVTCIDNDISWGEGVTHPHQMIPSFRTDGYLRNNLTEQEKKVVSHLQQEGLSDPISYIRQERQAFTLAGRAVFLPPVMDTDMVAKFKILNEVALKKWMSDFDFTDGEKEAACSRLRAIHSHIHVLEQQRDHGAHSIISPDQWGSKETTERLFPQEGNAGNALQTFTSYLHRDIVIRKRLGRYETSPLENILAERFIIRHGLDQLTQNYPDFKETFLDPKVRAVFDRYPKMLDKAKQNDQLAQVLLNPDLLFVLVEYPSQQPLDDWKILLNPDVQDFLYRNPKLRTRAEKKPDFAKVCLNLRVLRLFAEHPGFFDTAWNHPNFGRRLLDPAVRSFLRNDPTKITLAITKPDDFDQEVDAWSELFSQ